MIQRLNTRDELGFERRLVLLKMLMENALPKMGELLVMMMMISPSEREVPLAESLRRRAKVFMPKFRLEAAALHL